MLRNMLSECYTDYRSAAHFAKFLKYSKHDQDAPFAGTQI